MKILLNFVNFVDFVDFVEPSFKEGLRTAKGGGVIGPYVFEKDVRRTTAIKGERYR